MSTNGVNVEDADMAECDGEKVVTMMDVLQEQQAFEEDANAVLGASDDKNCTYNKGYIKRQALYACLTCCGDARDDPSKRAGVCLACSLACHENHDLVELYTKRNFRCDCGNPKFQQPCTYTPNKKPLNDENQYDQNFSGLYCICHRPYPDPDGIEEEMIQCIICEDWLHASHLEATIPSSDSYAEMICKACMEKNEFLHDYSEFAVNSDVDVVGVDENDDRSVKDESSKMNGVVENDTEANGKVEDKPIDDVKEDESKLNTNPTEVNPSLTNNVSVDQTEPKSEAAENCNGDNTSEIENKPKKNETEIATTEEFTAEKPESDEQMSKINTEVEDAKADVDMLTENDKTTHNGTNEAVKAANGDGSSENEIKVGNDTEIKQADSPTGDPKEAISSDNNTVDDKDSTNSGDIGEDPQSETNESRPATEEVKTDEEETKMNETETNTLDVDTKPAEEQKETSNEHAETNPLDVDTNPAEEQQETSIEHAETIATEQANNLDKPVDSSVSNDNSPTKRDFEMDESTNVANNEATETKEHKRKLSIEEDEDISVKKPKLEGKKCIRPKSKNMFKGATFWPSHFRQKLCTCNECITMYKDLAVLFLLDPEDTVMAYETLGKEQAEGTSSASSYERGIEALSSLDRIQQINAVTEYNKMRDKLLDFLKSFKDRKEVVKEEDIKTFFANMKPKREPDGVYFCR